MFGLTFEKLFVIAVLAAVIIGPQRLPLYTRRLSRTVAGLREIVRTARLRAEDEIGVPLNTQHWESFDIRQYDPRRIMRDALDASPPSEASSHAPAQDTVPTDTRPSATTRDRRYAVTGSSAHPRRVLIEDEVGALDVETPVDPEGAPRSVRGGG
jgi:sec-independent protein translocase protein TatB